MPTYVYKCEICKKEKELLHEMKLIDNPNEWLVENTNCCFGKMTRVPQLTGSSSFQRLSKSKKQEVLKERSKAHYNKEIKEVKKTKPFYEY